MRGEHYSKRPQPEENSGTYANSVSRHHGNAIRLLAVERCHNHPDACVMGGKCREEGGHQVGHCVEDVRKGYV
jgi:hypothetical protein